MIADRLPLGRFVRLAFRILAKGTLRVLVIVPVVLLPMMVLLMIAIGAMAISLKTMLGPAPIGREADAADMESQTEKMQTEDRV